MSRPAPLSPSTSVADALDLVLTRTRAMAPLPAEQLGLADAAGRVLAQALQASWPLPAADVSMMDGWAVRAADLATATSADGTAQLPASTRSTAGHPSAVSLPRGEAARVFTGAVLPGSADAVIPQEDVEVGEADGRTRLTIDAAACRALVAGRFVRRQGSEVAADEVVAATGTRLDAGSLAALAAVGHATVHVHRRPRVAIVSTGDELVPLGQRPGAGQIVSSNGLMLAALVREAGGEPLVLADAPDDEDALRATLAEGLRADVLLTSGGISVGDHDLVRPQLEALGVQIDVHGLALRPGKPTAFGVRDETLVFALPGNPASGWVAFLLLVAPALAVRSGDATPRVPLTLSVRTSEALRGAGRRAHYVRARWSGDGIATPLSAQRSGNLRSIGGVDLLLIVPAGVEAIAAGQSCEAVVVRPPELPA